ncbi:MAG: hypothetical protein ACLQUY_26565 [Ktedonobacterales bacterium]
MIHQSGHLREMARCLYYAGGDMSIRLKLQFDQNLSGFLSPSHRHGTFELALEGTPSIKDVIESLGVPHTEPGIILVNQVPVPFRTRPVQLRPSLVVSQAGRWERAP